MNTVFWLYTLKLKTKQKKKTVNKLIGLFSQTCGLATLKLLSVYFRTDQIIRKYIVDTETIFLTVRRNYTFGKGKGEPFNVEMAMVSGWTQSSLDRQITG